jgi:hypothetical protein
MVSAEISWKFVKAFAGCTVICLVLALLLSLISFLEEFALTMAWAGMLSLYLTLFSVIIWCFLSILVTWFKQGQKKFIQRVLATGLYIIFGCACGLFLLILLFGHK